MNAMVSGAFSENGEVDGFPDIKVKPNINSHAVLILDTEQLEGLGFSF